MPPRPSTETRPRGTGWLAFVALGVLAWSGHVWLSLVFTAEGTARDVWTMIVLLWAQFAVMGLAWWLARKMHQPSAAAPYLSASTASKADFAPRQAASLPASRESASSLHLQAATAPRNEAVASSGLLRRVEVSRERRAVVIVMVFAALFRLTFVLAGLGPVGTRDGLHDLVHDVADDARGRDVTYDAFLLYDNDVWRYLWDGHVSAHGLDPYRLTPRDIEIGYEDDDPRLGPLLEPTIWSDVFDNVSYGEYHSVYPPLAQSLFRVLHAVAPASVGVTKLALAVVDFGTCCLLLVLLRRRGRPVVDVMLYAWNPLVLKEISGSGHLDGVVIALVVATVLWLVEGRGARALVAFAAAIMAKLAPLVLAGLVLLRTPPRQWWWGGAAGVALALPWVGGFGAWLAGLGAFSRDWQFFPGPWALVRWLVATLGVADPATWARAVCAVLLVATVVCATLYVLAARFQYAERDARLLRAVFVILAALPLLNAAVMPWYLLWALPFAITVGCRSWHVLLMMSLLSYQIYIDQQESAWTLIVGHGTFAGLAGLEWAMRWRKTVGALAADRATNERG